MLEPLIQKHVRPTKFLFNSLRDLANEIALLAGE
jgi:hypothetical protein